MKTCLRCNCGQHVFRRDVMRRGFYLRQTGPSYVYVKFRCSRCKKLGEHFIRQDEWNEDLISDKAHELSTREKERFARLGAITLDEMRDFHLELDRLETLPNPLAVEIE